MTAVPILDKASFRREAARRRVAAHAADPAAAAGLAAHGSAALASRAFEVVAGYWPMRSEIDPRLLMERLLGRGVRLCLPVVVGPGPLEFRRWRPGDELACGPLGTSHPSAGAEALEPDLLLVPLLAFDRRRHRLGYGAGHYDATLATLRAKRPVFAVGVAYAAQAVDAVPLDPWDEKLDLVVTEVGVF
jgi:5-formyltetrahydrofolate cyclo-ligase